MAYYIKIAPQESNSGGITSKGYVIYRRGLMVYLKWGAIKSKNRRFYWAGENLPQEKDVPFKTVPKLNNFFDQKTRHLSRQEYNKLPIGKKIFKSNGKL